MKSSSNASVKLAPPRPGEDFVLAVRTAMRRAAHQVAAENKRLGLPMIVEKERGSSALGGKN